MHGQDKDLGKTFLSYLDNKQYSKLQLEVKRLGIIEDLPPLLIFYYACAITLNQSSKIKDLRYAANLFEKLYLNNKKDLQLLYNMISISFRIQEFKFVLPHIEEAYKTNQNDNNLLIGLSKIHLYLANLRESIKYFKQLYKITPTKKIDRSEFLTALNYANDVSQEYYLSECLEYSKLINQNKDTKNVNFVFKHLKKEPIKIGFLSNDFKTHPISFFLKGLLANINKDKFEINLISNLHVSQQDNMSRELKLLVQNWIDINRMSDSEATKLIRSLEIDILIDLCGFFRGNRFQVIANRSAKVQMGWLGYNNTLGTKNLDYLISDSNLIKKDETKLYLEKILYLPKIWNAMSPPENLPDIKKNTPVFTYASFNNFHKISDDTFDVWSKILKNSNSQLLLKNSMPLGIVGNELKLNILEKFISRGVDKNKILFKDHKSNLYDHLNLYNEVDVALDTFPYPGVTTSFEAILMGVPVLTMKGFNFNSRCGESINKNLSMEEFIAKNKSDYFAKAIEFQEEKKILKFSGLPLREKALKSPLFDMENFTKDFTEALKEVYSKTNYN